MTTQDRLARYADLPGADLVAQGAQDLREGRQSSAALLVAMAATRLREAGLEIPEVDLESPSHRLYELLAAEEPDTAHSRYNALVGRIVSFASAAERARLR